ncbi:response regulator [Microlunatus soli]|uniref:DNA-binding response regulator, NarL/FixJ family, contains REC and HTH domains n=1 Tax=Microlunatus soli TaxID=630515 RepID=A0A1H1X805_9ACTN|nr:response regulator transcription factor [Microlunatus soli]SDT05455.1 DNA-binding response regulator, NarL/FixJ family, contains REC and HTH domains [Microlunatus soli]
MAEIRIVLVDDHPVVRGGLRAALGSADGLTVVGEAGTGEDALALATEVHPDVVLMDLQLGPGIDGAEATARLAQLADPPRVLVLTTYDRDADILPAIAAGANGYLLKDTDPERLVQAIRDTAAGRTVLAPTVADRLVDRARQPLQTLTRRETEILQMVARGSSNREVGRSLFITEATVKSHLVQVFSKLHADNRTTAVAEARRRGIIG